MLHFIKDNGFQYKNEGTLKAADLQKRSNRLLAPSLRVGNKEKGSVLSCLTCPPGTLRGFLSSADHLTPPVISVLPAQLLLLGSSAPQHGERLPDALWQFCRLAAGRSPLPPACFLL